VHRGQQWMAAQHTRAGVAHHFPDTGFHVGLVAVDRALGAGRLLVPEWAAVEAGKRVVLELPALSAWRIGCRMMSLAVQRYHRANSSFLPLDPRHDLSLNQRQRKRNGLPTPAKSET
jgi:hypothetical protein